MARQPNSFGGGAQTNINGLTFERNMDLLTVIDALPNFHTVNNKIYLKNILVAEHFSKYGLYKNYLLLNQINWQDFISSQLLPDDVLITQKSCYIIEKKFQNTGGSVDEILTTFPFKTQQYQKMFTPLGKQVHFYYLLSEWFDKPKYKDPLQYIRDNQSDYFFNVADLLNKIVWE